MPTAPLTFEFDACNRLPTSCAETMLQLEFVCISSSTTQQHTATEQVSAGVNREFRHRQFGAEMGEKGGGGNLLITLADHSLNLALVGWVDVISVLRPHQHCSILEGSALHLCPLALYHRGCQNGHHVLRKGCNVACHSHKHPCSALHAHSCMIRLLH